MKGRSAANTGLTVLIVLLAASAGWYFIQQGRRGDPDFVITGSALAAGQRATVAPVSPGAVGPAEVVVHVTGEVARSGVVRLKPGSRVEDAVNASGGPTQHADVEAINLAALLDDGQQILVPRKGEATTLPAATRRPTASALPRSATGSPGRPPSAPAKLKEPGQGTVNLNRATADDLQKLPGIGPAMAARILQFRKDNGAFTDPEQLMDVSGIGEKKFAKMKPFVRVR